MPADLLERVAGAPISWGVCEAPGWGVQLSPGRFLAELAGLGLSATELGPPGWLPPDAGELRAFLDARDVRLVGAFHAAVLHTGGLPGDVAGAARLLEAAGARHLVLSADTEQAGYDQPAGQARAVLDEPGWQRLLTNLNDAVAVASERGVTASLHPHAGTMIERRDEVHRLLADSAVPLCLDTGHVAVGGGDPAAIARAHPDRVVHVHLKDVRASLADQVRSGALPYQAAVRAGLYRPLGQGDVDIAGTVRALEDAGYRGWYVLEQDVTLDTEPPPGTGPVEDVRASLQYLQRLVDPR